MVVSLSLGAERTFVMTPRMPAKVAGIVVDPRRAEELQARESVRLGLEEGSLLVMQGRLLGLGLC